MVSVFRCDGVVPKLPMAEQLISLLMARRTKRSRRLKFVLPFRYDFVGSDIDVAPLISPVLERLGLDDSAEGRDAAVPLVSVFSAAVHLLGVKHQRRGLGERGCVCLAPTIREGQILEIVQAVTRASHQKWLEEVLGKWAVIGPQAALEKKPTNAAEYLRGFSDAASRMPDDGFAIYLVNFTYHRDLPNGVSDIDGDVFAERDKIVLGELAKRRVPAIAILDCGGDWSPTEAERFAAMHRATLELAAVAITEWYEL